MRCAVEYYQKRHGLRFLNQSSYPRQGLFCHNGIHLQLQELRIVSFHAPMHTYLEAND